MAGKEPDAARASATAAPSAGAAGPEAGFRAFLRAGRFMIQRSRSTGRHVFPPCLAAPGTGETDLEWVEASGLGTVYASTVDRRDPAGTAGAGPPRNICLVALDEGPRLMGRVEGIAPAMVAIGMRVRARIAAQEGEPILLFDPAAAPPPAAAAAAAP